MNGMSDILKNYVLNTTKSIVDHPNDIVVDVSITTKAIIMQIKGNRLDSGKIIGKMGRTIESLKVLCLAIKNTKYPDDSRRIILEVVEEENSSFRYKKREED
jgi:predicted RNA-binding protein YlqC (UPF0109 family)